MDHALRLIVLASESEPGPAESLECGPDGATIGRSPACAVCLPDARVSRRHARVSLIDGGWFVRDLGSSGGTQLNGVALAPEEPTSLASGDLLEIGPWILRVQGETGDRPGSTFATLTGSSFSAVEHRPSRRLTALSSCIDAFVRAGSEQELAEAALRSAIAGGGYQRGAILRPPGDHAVAEVVTAIERRGGGWGRPDPGSLQAPRSLIDAAAGGTTASLDPRSDAATSGTIAAQDIHSAVCAPVMLDGRVHLLMYLDARAGERPIRDGAGFCEDVARLYALAAAYTARGEMQRRQSLMRAEMERARVLRAMLAPPPLLEAGGYRIACAMRAGLFVSGDLFDVHERPGEGLTALFGDASGHGVGAAMLSGLAQSHLIAELAHGVGPLAAVDRTNRFIAPRPTRGAFVSLWVAALSPTGLIRFTDAGHGHWFIARGDGTIDPPPAATGPPVGVTALARYEEGEITLRAGDRLVLYTDGVSEARERDGQEIGCERVRRAVRGGDGCQDDVDRLMRLLDEVGGAEDDASVASIEYLGRASGRGGLAEIRGVRGS